MKYYLKITGSEVTHAKDFPSFSFKIKSGKNKFHGLKNAFQKHIETLLSSDQPIPLPRVKTKNSAMIVLNKPLSHRVLKQYVDLIHEEIVMLNFWAGFRLQYHTILNISEVGKVESHFWHFAAMSFSHEIVRRICTLTENQNPRFDPILSLRSLLDACSKNKSFLSRDLYLRCSPPTLENFKLNRRTENNTDDYVEELFNRLNSEFTELAGNSGKSISIKTIRKDILDLESVSENLTKFRNKRIAHNDLKGRWSVSVRYDEVSKALKKVNDISQKYYLLIHCSWSTQRTYLPSIEPIFSKPWISNDEVRKIFQKIHNEIDTDLFNVKLPDPIK